MVNYHLLVHLTRSLGGLVMVYLVGVNLMGTNLTMMMMMIRQRMLVGLVMVYYCSLMMTVHQILAVIYRVLVKVGVVVK